MGRTRRLLLDLTPMIDVIMILLFGSLISSASRFEKDVEQVAREQAAAVEEAAIEREQRLALTETAESLRDQKDKLKQTLEDREIAVERMEREHRERTEQANQQAESLRILTANLEAVQAERDRLKRSMEQASNEARIQADLVRAQREQQNQFAQGVAAMLGLDESAQQRLERRMGDAHRQSAQRVRQVLEEIHSETDPLDQMRAVQRLSEMRKVFSFVDIHLRADQTLTVRIDLALEPTPVMTERKSLEEVEIALRRKFEEVSFQSMVLILYSYDPRTPSVAVEDVEKAITKLVDYLRSTQPTRTFRYGRVGIVESNPSVPAEN